MSKVADMTTERQTLVLPVDLKINKIVGWSDSTHKKVTNLLILAALAITLTLTFLFSTLLLPLFSDNATVNGVASSLVLFGTLFSLCYLGDVFFKRQKVANEKYTKEKAAIAVMKAASLTGWIINPVEAGYLLRHGSGHITSPERVVYTATRTLSNDRIRLYLKPRDAVVIRDIEGEKFYNEAEAAMNLWKDDNADSFDSIKPEEAFIAGYSWNGR